MTEGKRLPAAFFRTTIGVEPVREWLLSLSPEDRKEIGGDIQAAEYGWPIGLPLCRSVAGHKGLWEIRSSLEHGRIARVLFTVSGDRMVLLHGFEKKTQKAPRKEIDIAMKRMRGLK